MLTKSKEQQQFSCPVVIYPKDKMLAIAKLLKEAEKDTASQKEFASVEDMFADMGLLL